MRSQIVYSPWGACPPCGAAGVDLKALRTAYCMEDGRDPVNVEQGAACGAETVATLERSCGKLPACKPSPMQFVRPAAMFVPEESVAVAGKSFNVAWQGGRLDANVDLQVLVGAGCAGNDPETVDVAKSSWKTVETLKGYTGNNGLQWTVPADFVAAGAPQWTRLRVVAQDDAALMGVSSPVLVAQPTTVAVKVNGAPLPSDTVAPLDSKPSTNVDLADSAPVDATKQGLEDGETQAAAVPADDPDALWGSARVVGSVAQVQIDFTGRSARRAAHEIGHVVAVELTLANDEIASALEALTVSVGSEAYSIEAPFADATYACSREGNKCVLDKDDQSLKATPDELPTDQLCVFANSFNELVTTSVIPQEETDGKDESSASTLAGAAAALVAAAAVAVF